MTLTTTNIFLHPERNVTLTAMVQSVGGEFGEIHARPAVVILPGGGYSMCSDREAECIAYPYLSAGYHAFVLRYSLAEHRDWPNPLNDFEDTMALLEEKAQEWHILTDKIAVIGFSAGGHLAACAATMAKHRPAAAILGYAAYAQDIIDACQPRSKAPSPIDMVDDDTAPCFLFAARDDNTVPITGLLAFEQKLTEYSIQFESHIYAYGGHGFGPGTACVYGTNVCSRIPRWQADSIAWLEDLFGRPDIAGMTRPVCPPKVNMDHAKTLSVYCTLGHLRIQQAAMPVLEQILSGIDAVEHERFGDNPAVFAMLDHYTLREMLALMSRTTEEIAALEDKLNAIPNQL